MIIMVAIRETLRRNFLSSLPTQFIRGFSQIQRLPFPFQKHET
jgi:hypothetical protein